MNYSAHPPVRTSLYNAIEEDNGVTDAFIQMESCRQRSKILATRDGAMDPMDAGDQIRDSDGQVSQPEGENARFR